MAAIQYSMQGLAVELDALSGCMDLWKLVIKILCLVLERALFLFCGLVSLLFIPLTDVLYYAAKSFW